VNVSDLQQLLASVGQILTAAGSKAAGEIDYFSQKLTPFRDKKLKALADLIDKEARGGPFKSVEEALAAIQSLDGRALSPEVTEDAIRAEVGRCEKLSKPQLDDLARRFEIERKFTKKDQAIQAIAQKILDRKGAYDRARI
jgi:hypothetical protein